ncbi:uncharacterized protein A1O9_02567 [Exophiala aquamarina CBS 119918]|uniref:AB hydrolase-1 domain-containing protein n=1 Tax=Exophiala aquamarina CBS 119918 TaxID=1182545 RepID=A0A072PNT0_9EURO|nr:uncharacterized protein A1O9_02567 [Exophiala aquamarina CBS 119918]KEF61003.1 hypothetical protein A1O9_02567 [Exophiala aquamarina CBS 119918]
MTLKMDVSDAQLELNSTVSKDGTRIAYYKLGRGPGLIIIHGAMQSGLSHSELAFFLSKSYTCYLPDRRGRGKSGPSGSDYCLIKEVEDVEALQSTTGAKYVFGVSSGAVIALKAALIAPSSHLERVAVFEPPWWPDFLIEESTAWVSRYEEELSRGDIAEALTTA